MIRDNPDFKLINNTFPHVGKKLEFMWGYPEFNQLIHDLQHDNREGKRTGFPMDLLMALFNLALAHDKQYPNLVRGESDVWTPSKAR